MMKKRLASILMALCMVLTMLPTQAFAEDAGAAAVVSEPDITLGDSGTDTEEKDNTTIGDSNTTPGSSNVVIGDSNTTPGSSNIVIGDSSTAAPKCSCVDTPCTPDAVDSFCLLCGAEGADLSAVCKLLRKKGRAATPITTRELLQDAITAATGDTTITLAEGFTSDSTTVTIPNVPHKFTLDLNGQTLDGGTNKTAITHNGTGTLTITDSKTDGGGKVTASTPSGAIEATKGTAGATILEVTGGTVENTGIGSTIKNLGAGKVTVSDNAIVKGNTGPAIYNNSTGAVTVSGGTVTSANAATATIILSNGTAGQTALEITGGTVENTSSGRAISNGGVGTVKVSGTATVSSGTGRAIDSTSTGLISISGGTVTASSNDATIQLSGGTAGQTALEITGGIVQNTGADVAIYNNGEGAVTIGGGKITGGFSGINNTILLSKGSLSITAGTVENTGAGSAIRSISTGAVTVSGGTVSATTGAAIYNNSTGLITVSGGMVTNSRNTGGTIQLFTGTLGTPILEITGGTVKNTGTGVAAVAVTSASGTITITGGSVNSITATTANTVKNGSGTAIYMATLAVSGSGIPTITGYNLTGAQAINGNWYVWLPAGEATATYDGKTYKTTVKTDDTAVFTEYVKPVKNTSVSPVKEYDTLQAAITEVKSGEVLQLQANLTENVTIPIDTPRFTLDLNGQTLDGGSATPAIACYGIETLTITDTKGGGGGTVTGATSNNGTILLNSSYLLTITGGTVKNTGAGPAIRSNSKGAVTVSGTATVSATTGHAIDNNSTGAVTVSGGTVSATTGAAIFNNSTGLITVSGGLLTSTRDTGTIHLFGGTSGTTILKITGGTVGNSSTGRVIYNNGTGAVTVAAAATITPEGALYPVTTDPAASVTKAGLVAGKATYTLSGTPAPSNCLVYSAATGGSPLTTVTASMSGNTLTLAGSGLTVGSTYYVTAYDRAKGKGTSAGRLALKVVDTPTASDLTFDLTAVDYSGSAKTVSVTATGGKDLGTITVKYGGSTAAPINAGTYAITVDTAGSNDYASASGLSLGNFIINKIAATDAMSKVPTSVIQTGKADATVTLPTLPTGASYGTPTAGGTVSMTGMSITGTTLTYTAPPATAGQTGTITIPVTGATNYNNYNIIVTVTYESKTPQAISYANADIRKTYGDAKFTNPLTQTTVNGAISYASDDTAVATVNSTTGEVTIVGYGTDGTATITATAAETTTYAQATATYTITVNKKALTISGVTAGNKVYDGTTTATPVGTAVVSGKVGSDDVTVTGGTAAFADKNVGTGKVVTFSGYALAGTATGNYTLTAQPASVTVNITAKPLTVTGLAATNREYDGTTAVALTGGALSGNVSGDDVACAIPTTGTMADKKVGNSKAVAIGTLTLTGTTSGNYTLTPPTVTVNITPKALSIINITAVSREYNGTTAIQLRGGTLTGTVAGDSVNFELPAVNNTADKDVGTGKSVTIGTATLTLADKGNYTLTQPTGLTVDITVKTLTAKADDKRVTIGAPLPAYTVSYSGLVGGDTKASVVTTDAAAACTATDTTVAGEHTITCSGGLLNTGGAGKNYTMAYTNGKLTIAAAPPPSTGGGGGGSSSSAPANKVIDSTTGSSTTASAVQQAVADTAAGGTVFANFADYTTLTTEGIAAINKAAGGKKIKIQLDDRQGTSVLSRITVDPQQLAASTKENLPVGLYYNQIMDTPVTSVNGIFEKYFDNKVVSIAYAQRSTLPVSAEVALKLDLGGLNKSSLRFYSYNPITNRYTSIYSPNYWVDRNGYTHITAPMGGNIVITDKPLTLRK